LDKQNKGKLTMKKMFRESFIGHELSNKQSLVSIGATSNQVS